MPTFSVSFQSNIKSPFLRLNGTANKLIAANILIMVSDNPKDGKMLLIKVLKIQRDTVTAKMPKTIFSLERVGPNFLNSTWITSFEAEKFNPLLGKDEVNKRYITQPNHND